MPAYGSLEALRAARGALALVQLELASASPEKRDWFVALATELADTVADAQRQFDNRSSL